VQLEPVLSDTYLGSTILEYGVFFTIVGAGVILGRSLSFLYERRFKTKAEATDTELDDIVLHSLSGPVILLGLVLGVAVGRQFLTPVEPLRSVMAVSVEIPVILAIAWLAIRLTDGLIETYMMEYAEQTESKLDDELVPIASRITNIGIGSIAAIVIMDSVGFDVTAIIASLGVGGLAVAFAARKTMADLFGGAHILSTKPFVVEDIVDIDGTTGTVEEIGLRTTRIRDFDGRTITVPNSVIANAEVKNVTSEATRRVDTYIGLTYDTTAAEMQRALTLSAETVADVNGVDAEDAGAWFWEYGDRAMQIRLTYHVEDLDRWKEVRNDVNTSLQVAFEEAGLDLAVPVGTLRLDEQTA